MANYTKKAIIQTFEDMLSEMSFDKITVTALITRCEISSNTFYYYFHNIFDLADAYLVGKRDKYLSQESLDSDWKGAMKSFLYAIKDNPKTVSHLYNSLSWRRLEEHVFKISEKWLYDFMKRKVNNKNISEELFEKISSFLCYSMLGFLLKFMWTCGNTDIEREVDDISEIVSGCMKYIISEGNS